MGTIRKSDYFIHKNFDVSSLPKSNLTRGPAYSYIRVLNFSIITSNLKQHQLLKDVELVSITPKLNS